MYKSCSRCGKIHDINYVCTKNKPKINWSKYNKNNEEYKLRNTYQWHSKAEEIKKRALYLCEVCKDKGIYNYNNLEIHHIVKLRNDSSKLLDNYNLVCLCVYHHKLADKNKIDKDYLLRLAKLREDKQE